MVRTFRQPMLIEKIKSPKKTCQSRTKNISTSFIERESTIHNFDVVNSDLSDLGKHEGYVERQLNRWNKQFDRGSI